MKAHRVACPSQSGQGLTVRSPDHPLLGRYRLTFLARGGMGCAYRGQVGERSCFVKEVPLADARAALHLRGEAQMLQRLPLGNFSRFVEICEADGHLYLVTEFIEGLTLEQEVQRSPWIFPEDSEIRQLAQDLCRQLEILHALRPPILYLDLKPANVIRTAKGQIFLVDFGISRVFLPPFTLGDYQGSPQTASPEHFTGRLEPRSDLFCLAATVHYVVTRGQAQRADFGAFPAAAQYHPDLSSPLAAWLEKCLALNPEDRFTSVRAARLALDGGPVAAPEPPTPVRSWLGWLKS
ncbi:serine/threonine protein kinase [bacterium]|nr:serine/threonine protein kinase [bacterium]